MSSNAVRPVVKAVDICAASFLSKASSSAFFFAHRRFRSLRESGDIDALAAAANASSWPLSLGIECHTEYPICKFDSERRTAKTSANAECKKFEAQMSSPTAVENERIGGRHCCGSRRGGIRALYFFTVLMLAF